MDRSRIVGGFRTLHHDALCGTHPERASFHAQHSGGRASDAFRGGFGFPIAHVCVPHGHGGLLMSEAATLWAATNPAMRMRPMQTLPDDGFESNHAPVSAQSVSALH